MNVFWPKLFDRLMAAACFGGVLAFARATEPLGAIFCALGVLVWLFLAGRVE